MSIAIADKREHTYYRIHKFYSRRTTSSFGVILAAWNRLTFFIFDVRRQRTDIMRAALVTSFAYAAVIHVSNAFTHSATPVTVRPCTSAKRFPDTLYVQTSDKGKRAIDHKNATPEQRKVLGNQLREDENSACEKSPYATQMAALDDDTLINLMRYDIIV